MAGDGTADIAATLVRMKKAEYRHFSACEKEKKPWACDFISACPVKIFLFSIM
jgi:hypothetical protein